MSPELLKAVSDYMQSTEVFRDVTARKIASLQDSNDVLSADKAAIASSVEALVTKMASAGIINDMYAVHLSTKAAKQMDIAASLNKLSELIDENTSKKMATAPQLYMVDESSNSNNNNTSEFEESWKNRLTILGRKA